MIRTHLNRALVISAALLLTSGAAAQSPNSSPVAKAAAGDKDKDKKPENKGSDKAPDKAADSKTAADKGADKGAADKDKGGADKAKAGPEAAAKNAEERAARKLSQHNAQKEKLRSILKAPPDAALKQELRRHAERVARLERIKQLATDAKDTDGVDRSTKLLAKENARHEKWMMEKVPVLGAAGATPAANPVNPAAATPTPDPKNDKAGAK